jgi:putative phosphoesterase
VRVLVVSDIHGNWPALEAVAAVPHDAIVCLGDIVGYGPQPGECLRWLRANGAEIVQGNHDRALADDVPPRCRPDFEKLAAAAADIAQRQLADEEKEFLRGLPRTRALVIDGRRLLLAHATPVDPLYRYLGPEPEGWRSIVSGLDAELILVGHTHTGFQLHVGSVEVVNPGSVGQPKDGDPRAAFAIIEDGVPKLERASYDVQRTVEALSAARIDAAALGRLVTALETGRFAGTDSSC